MNFRIPHIAILLFLNLFSSYGQQAIHELTLSIVDTTESPIDQAKDIYSWVSSTIKYDVKTFNKNEYSNRTTEQVLKQKKGLCSDFALLYQAMCNSVNIEAYTISGYSKGYSYNNQKSFLRSNHSWNIVYTGSQWIHVDATWGSGYIDTKPRTYQKILYSIAKVPYASNKTVFFQDPSDAYFNIRPDSLIKTHYPLDPKWLLSESPISFESFEKDSIDQNIYYPFFEQEIEKIRNKSNEYIEQIEGVNGNIYNKHNYFDLANGYYIKSSNYNLEREVTTNNYYQFENYLDDYTIIIEAIDKHKSLTDSVYRARSKYLRQVARDQKRLTGRIKSKAKKAQDSYRSSQKGIVGKSSSYKKKMNGYQINIGRSEIKKIPLIIKKELEYADTLQFNMLINEIMALEEQQPETNKRLDSLLKVVDNFSYIDAQIDDSIAAANSAFKTNIDILGYMVLIGQEKVIVDYVDSLKVVYQEIEDFLDDKKNAKNDLQNTGRAFYTHSGELQKNLKQQMTLYQKLLKTTNNSDSVIHAYNKRIDKLIISYRQAIIFTRKLKNHTEIQSDIRQENLNALKEQKKSITKENKFFVAWYDNHISKEKTSYTKEKEIIKLIRSASLRNQKAVELKLDKYTKQDVD